MSDLHWIEELREKAEAAKNVWPKYDEFVCGGWTGVEADYLTAASPDRILQLLSLLHEVSTDADPAGTVRELAVARETIRAQEVLIQELRAEVSKLKEGRN